MALVPERYETSGKFPPRVGERGHWNDREKREKVLRGKHDGDFENGESALGGREDGGEFVRFDAEEVRGRLRGYREEIRGWFVK